RFGRGAWRGSEAGLVAGPECRRRGDTVIIGAIDPAHALTALAYAEQCMVHQQELPGRLQREFKGRHRARRDEPGLFVGCECVGRGRVDLVEDLADNVKIPADIRPAYPEE